MTIRLRRFDASLLRVIAFCACLTSSFARAQEDPFGATPKPAGEPEATPLVAPRPTGRLPATVEREPLVIEMLRASNPMSPDQLLSAAQSAFQFGRLDIAKNHLAKLIAEKPADETLAALTSGYGTFLLQIGAAKDLQPEGRQAAELILSAAQRLAQDQSRIESAITKLTSADEGARQAALEQLSRAQTAAVTPMLRVLADSARIAEHPAIRTALVQLGEPVEAPLIAALDSPNESLKNQVIAVLGRLGSRRARIFLIRSALDRKFPFETRQLASAVLERVHGAVPDEYEGGKYLAQQIPRLLAGETPFDADENDRITIWLWDETTQQAVPGKLPRLDAGLMLAARLASDLYVLKRGESAAQRLMIITNLELAKTLAGFSQPISATPGSPAAAALAAGPEALSAALSEALRMGKTGAAAAVAELLGQIGDASILRTSGAESPLAEAIHSTDRRVRFASALAAVKIAPGEQFVGAGRLVEALGWFVTTAGSESVLIGHPRGEEAQTLVGFANALGFEGQGAYTGRNLTERAFANPDISVALISDAIDKPPVEELVQWLRRDYRTARLPVGVMARGERLLALEAAFASDPYTTVFPRIHSVEVCAIELKKLTAIAGRNLVNRDERVAQARSALSALKTLAQSSAVFAQYDLQLQESIIIGALDNPALAAEAADVLQYYPTAPAQTALVNAASQSNRSLPDRQAAAAAFAASVKLRGLLLTQSQIAQQYLRYNASQAEDNSTQALFGSVLDAIEAPALARGDFKK